MVMWVVVFAIVISATVMFITPVKRAITAKILASTDFALWRIWGPEVKEEGGWNHNQIDAVVSTVSQSLDAENIEDKGKVTANLDASSNSHSEYSSY